MSEPTHEPLSHAHDESPGDTRCYRATATADADLLAALADEFAARVRRGERPTVEEYVGRHPALAERITKVLQAVAMMEETRSLGAVAISEGAGDTIGRYKLLERIGEGGFGVVYMAEQQFPVRRKVALKVIKPGVDTRQVIARFEAERQALAIMEHENIAKVLDAGATDSGRPYFVMELVRGVPITEYCDKNELPPRERLELFVQVCRAVQHAHTKGIIHRDLKPTNVLVTLREGVPVPKVIDFGVAKATGQQLTEKTLFTNFAQMVGTPLYMSPEQAEMTSIDVDTRSDVYSLGVLLYELLTGTTPLDQERLKRSAFDEIRRIIREEEPPRPSTRLSTMGEEARRTISAQRRSDPKQLGQFVRGELDWIVMKALEKERARRYETANALALDIGRYLAGEPIEAKRDSAIYVFRKALRRYRLPAAIAAGFVVLLTASLLVSLTLWHRASQERDTARQARHDEQRHRELAEQEKARANQRAEQLRWALYVNRIALAQHAYESSHFGAIAHLYTCPADLRGWEWYRLVWCTDRSVSTFRGHISWVQSVAWSPDGRHIASGAANGAVQLRDAVTQQEIVPIKGHTGPGTQWPSTCGVYCVRFSPDGQRIASACQDGTIKLWDAATGAEVITWRGHECEVRCLAFSPDGRRLVSGGMDSTIRFWDAGTGAAQRELHGHEAAVRSVAFSGNGRQIASASDDKTVRLWDADTGAEQAAFRGHEGIVRCVAFSPDDASVASGGGDKALRVWPVGLREEPVVFRGHGGAISSVAFSRDGLELASASDDGTVRLWDMMARSEKLTLRGHEDGVTAVAYAPDGQHIASASLDRTVKIWDRSSKAEALVRQAGQRGISRLAISPDGKRIVSGGFDATVKVWDAASGTEVAMLPGHTAGIRGVAFSRDSRRIAAASEDGTVRVWNASTGTEELVLRGKEQNARAVVFSPDGKRIVSSHYSPGSMVRVWDALTGAEISALPGGGGSINLLDFDADGKRFAGGGWDCSVHIWDAATGAETLSRGKHNAPISCVTFSPDGQRIASGSYNGELKVWSVETGAEILSVGGLSNYVQAAFSPDGARIVTGSWDGALRILEARTGEELLILRGHAPRGSLQVSFTPDGRGIISGAADDTLRIWRAADGKGLAQDPEAAYRLGRAAASLKAQNRLDEAQPLFEESQEMCRRLPPVVTRWTAGFMREHAQLLIDRGTPEDYVSAESLLISALAPFEADVTPNGVAQRRAALSKLQLVYGADGLKKPSALAEVNAGLAALPTTTTLAVGDWLLDLGRLSPEGVAKAVEHVRSMTALPESYLHLWVCGFYLTIGGDAEHGADALLNAVDRGARQPWHYNALGVSLWGCGRQEEARSAFRRALLGLEQWSPSPPEDAGPTQWTAAYFLDLVSEEEYARRWRDDLKLKEKIACTPWFYIGYRKEIAGKREEALAAYQRSVELGRLPDGDAIRHCAAYRLQALIGEPLEFATHAISVPAAQASTSPAG